VLPDIFVLVVLDAVLTPPDWVLLDILVLVVEVFDPAALDVLVEAGLLADVPLIAPAGGNDGSPLGPRSWLLPFKRFSACIS
jgi:hypothetical protein